jgi:hypothetical protein
MDGLILNLFTHSYEIHFWILIVPFLYKFVTGYSPTIGWFEIRQYDNENFITAADIDEQAT